MIVVTWERHPDADTSSRRGYRRTSNTPSADGIVTVPAAWSHQVDTITAEVTAAATVQLIQDSGHSKEAVEACMRTYARRQFRSVTGRYMCRISSELGSFRRCVRVGTTNGEASTSPSARTASLLIVTATGGRAPRGWLPRIGSVSSSAARSMRRRTERSGHGANVT